MGLVFLPLSGSQLRQWAAAGTLAGAHAGYAVTPAMEAAFELTDPEDAEYAALCIASIAGLLTHGERLVAVVEARPDVTDDEFGAVTVADVAFSAVSSLFGEDADPAPAAAAARSVAGMDLSRAWDDPTVQELLAGTDLLWYGPAEWSQLAQG